MKVITKTQANKLIQESLFKRGGTLKVDKLPFCTGKYKKGIINKEFNNPCREVVAVFAEYRRDKEGSYYKLKSLSRQ